MGAAGAYPFILSAPAGSRLAAHARPVRPATRTTQNVSCLCHHYTRGQHLHPTGAGRIAARGSRPVRSRPATAGGGQEAAHLGCPPAIRHSVSRHEVSTVQVCCLRPLLPSVAQRAAGSGRPQGFRLLVPSVCRACFSLVSLPARQVSTSRRFGYDALATPAPPSVRCRRFHRSFYPSLSFSLAHVGLYMPVRASIQPVRPPTGRLTAQRPGLRRDVTSPPCVQPDPPAQEPICRERFAYRCVRGCLLLRA